MLREDHVSSRVDNVALRATVLYSDRFSPTQLVASGGASLHARHQTFLQSVASAETTTSALSQRLVE